ncbi:tRNA dimethylallyltransferase 9 isoform X3 [Capsicum chacoense]
MERYIYEKPDVPKASREIATEVHSELADLQNDEDWDAAGQLLVKAGYPGAQSLSENDWYRLHRRLDIVKGESLLVFMKQLIQDCTPSYDEVVNEVRGDKYSVKLVGVRASWLEHHYYHHHHHHNIPNIFCRQTAAE